MTEDADVRLRLRSHLRDFIDRIEVFARGHRDGPPRKSPSRKAATAAVRRDKVSYRTEPAMADDIVDAAWDVFHEAKMPRAAKKRFAAFVGQLQRRRMSKEGRFLRIWFKTGAVLDLVPPGSLADGMACVDGMLRWQGPDVGRLWRDFTAAGR